ncbi:deoxyribodipyrimidine photo-lyase [bacterium M00.F.Ca.ET.228.01.1.1]|uniref:cryptochrome/photolyase family protein n=2 Tax=Pseudomonadota TaxID=1224 RepID=UPI001091B7DA|nr:deoxyribodipyrimidine photo-lyase [Paraburkholderia phenoliruptrix]TGP40416.1 deoxyribodipyrimidine photo-lyase [bacterium M00.F.Ca.ET.228.01.1.1]TGR96254.1 deoxyribodipyrimidine photo-lyase [bacterium M00.F.Ca.ET.191.01.1.1]TGT97454.1 deoxyribodipyrimidine photo-lyase [bacterium M00.F.Ca.ET.155.01.1.1]MBW0445921.1 deoxyribodipyrimidine photo-lyase [Paraburkholderia phenoliruptrix]MBW9101342.1 deoxyribodipyrimidine photo-lyase [Paraburkholderia phenoliruptrix]
MTRVPHSTDTFDTGLVWFRRDLRHTDNAALYYALKHCERVWCVFVFDTTILQPLIDKWQSRHPGTQAQDRRVEFILASLHELDEALRARGGGLVVLYGDPVDVVPKLAAELEVDAVFANHDYEPAAIERDEAVRERLSDAGRALRTFKDQVIFERAELLTGQNKPFTVFTPYKNAWLKQLTSFDLKPYPVETYANRLAPLPPRLNRQLPTLEQLGFAPGNLGELELPTGMSGAQRLLDDFLSRIDSYAERRDFPAAKGPSYLSVHLRFGTVSIRTLARLAHEMSLQPDGRGAATWLSELVWRDFYFMILAHHPRLAAGASFRADYDRLRWEQGPEAEGAFAAWCEGRTGYPLIDAAMLQLNRTGYMHNRLRMVTASFLVKDLGVDWRLGERYFAEQLNDYDFAANNGGWQWAASTGCDAQPYFRIFNPVTQSEKFDAEGRFIKRYLPQLAKLPAKWIHAPWLADAQRLAEYGVVLGEDYPAPIVDHAQARARTLARFGK